jgi:phenylpyruvate tautomerase PptA (4-oxalocrotonate tautomerase family)
MNMPLVRIALMKSTAADRGRKIGEAVYLQMVATLNVPPQDNFQIITEHDPNSLIYDPEYLGISRTDGIVLIQITLNEGRSTEMKRAFYAAVAEHLNAELGIRKQDILISLVEVKKENWSFGNGVAQYA